MAEYNPLEDPFSREKAWVTYRTRMKDVQRLRNELRQELEGDTIPVRESLVKALDILGQVTDNSVVYRVIRQALEARDAG